MKDKTKEPQAQDAVELERARLRGAIKSAIWHSRYHAVEYGNAYLAVEQHVAVHTDIVMAAIELLLTSARLDSAIAARRSERQVTARMFRQITKDGIDYVAIEKSWWERRKAQLQAECNKERQGDE